MNKFYLNIIVLFVLQTILPASDSTGVETVTGPLIQFETESHDFGTIRQGELVEHVFQFRNIGLDTLHISKVRSG